MAAYSRARVEAITLDPTSLDMPAIGHMVYRPGGACPSMFLHLENPLSGILHPFEKASKDFSPCDKYLFEQSIHLAVQTDQRHEPLFAYPLDLFR